MGTNGKKQKATDIDLGALADQIKALVEENEQLKRQVAEPVVLLTRKKLMQAYSDELKEAYSVRHGWLGNISIVAIWERLVGGGK